MRNQIEIKRITPTEIIKENSRRIQCLDQIEGQGSWLHLLRRTSRERRTLFRSRI